MISALKIAKRLGLLEMEVEPFGNAMAKINLNPLSRLNRKPEGKFIFITAITPTSKGEGKTVTAISLTMALNRLGKSSIATLRQPSTGLYFARKGRGSGGGRSHLIPQEEIDLHCTGDFHAITMAHNLIAAQLDNIIFRGNEVGFKLERIFWKRALDLCDRALREIIIGAKIEKNARNSGFIMTPASELMAILSLSRDIVEMRKRISKIILGLDEKGFFIKLEKLNMESNLVKVLKKALSPNLVLTAEHTPVLLHTGPFSNISHGNSSVLADEIGMRFVDYVVTEGGGGTDTGLEKFLDIKAPVLKRIPDTVVLVVTARALKMHGLASLNNGDIPDEAQWSQKNDDALFLGSMNMKKHIQNIKLFGFPLVVAINKFSYDTEDEIKTIKRMALEMGADFAVVHNGWHMGSQGAIELAEAVIEATRKPFHYERLYDDTLSIEQKLSKVATKIYGAENITLNDKAKYILKIIEGLEQENLGLCIAKTHLSLSHDSKLKNIPGEFILPIVGFIPFAGAGYICALTGNINLMPGMSLKSFGMSQLH